MESTPANLSTTCPLWNQWLSSCNSRRMSSFPPLNANRRLRVANRSGKSVNSAAATSPMRPWVLVTLAMATNSSVWFSRFTPGRVRHRKSTQIRPSFMPFVVEELIFHNLQRVTLLQLHAGGAKNGTNGLGGAALFADHLAQVHLRHAQFQHGGIAILNFRYLNFTGSIYQSMSNLLHERTHIADRFGHKVVP